MSSPLFDFLSSQPAMLVIRGLLLSSKPRHIRELASSYHLSPAGVSDIVRRLQAAGAVTESRQKNKRTFQLCLAREERECLKSFFKLSDAGYLQKRAREFERNAAAKLKWMDETFEFYRRIKAQ